MDFTALKKDVWIFLVFALWGGLSHYIGLVKGGKTKFSFFELFGDLVISGFSGMIALAFCEHLEFGEFLTGAMVGISGHMGSRSVFMMEYYISRRVQNTLKMTDNSIPVTKTKTYKKRKIKKYPYR